MRIVLPALAALALTGCAGAFRGPDTCTEIHFDATYVLARWAGWSPEEALTIAAADAWTDQHADTTSVATERRLVAGLVNPATLPWILCRGTIDLAAEGEEPFRAYGRRMAEATAWAVPSTGLRLHFPAVGLRSPVLPAFYLNPVSGEIEYGNAEARRVLERAFLDLECHDEDVEGTLALLGIGLHTLQDSIKHSGYNAAQGHIGAHPDPDSACCNLGAAMLSMEVTLNSLRYGRRLVRGRSSPPPPGWKDRILRILTGPAPTVEAAERRWMQFACEQFSEEAPGRTELLERWKAAGGEEVFTRALVKVEETLQ
ncbi:MAG TPA: DUF6765 family protein [Planctomycetota bacterium]|jgi:hypothetical protein|nr:DUF6765 family protein [Planctomycetota bacterium]